MVDQLRLIMGDTNCDFHYISECIKFQMVLYSSLKTEGFLPENGSEVFVRHIPPEATEHDLLKFFQTVGKVFQVRLMMSEKGTTNRGFGYVTFFNASTAKKAVAVLGLLPYKGSHYLTLESSLNNCRLFIGGIPTFKRKDQVWQELYSRGVKNIIDVIMYRSYSDRAENRGFVFVEFRTHEEAAHFRAKYGKSLRLWDSPVVVDWSVPIPQVDEDVMSTVKIIYLRNLDVCQSREELQAVILNFTSKLTIEKVYKFKNYAFIHVTTRHYAELLLEKLQGYFKGTAIEVTWAKPPSKFTTQDYRHNRVSHLSTHSYEKKSNSCNCYKSPSSQEVRNTHSFEKTASHSILSRNSSSSSLSTEDIRSLKPYEAFCRELSSNISVFKTSSKFSPYDFDIETRHEQDFDDLLNSSTGSGIFRRVVSPYVTLSSIAGSLTPESPHMEILPVMNGIQSSPLSKPRSFSSRENKNMEKIDWNSPKTETSSSSNSPHISMRDLEILPRDITLNDIPDIIGDIFD